MRRITKAKIKHISLVPRGANRFPVIYKAQDETVQFDPLVKMDMDAGEITAIVYAPEHRDSQGDIASAEVIKEMAHEFAKSGEGVDIRHDGKVVSKDQAFVAENFIVQKDDGRFQDIKDYDGNPVDVTGAWAVVIKVDDLDLRKAYRNGEWNGVSMGGTAVVEAEKSDPHTQGEIDMKPEDLTAALTKQSDAIVAGVGKAITDSLTKAGVIKSEEDLAKEKEKAAKAPQAPVFKGDWSDPNAVRTHEKALEVWKAEQDHGDDPVALFNARKAIEEKFAEGDSDTDKEAGIEKSDSPEVRELKRKLAKAQKASNQTDLNKDAASDGVCEGISKEDRELMATARKSVERFYGKKA